MPKQKVKQELRKESDKIVQQPIKIHYGLEFFHTIQPLLNQIHAAEEKALPKPGLKRSDSETSL